MAIVGAKERDVIVIAQMFPALVRVSRVATSRGLVQHASTVRHA